MASSSFQEQCGLCHTWVHDLANHTNSEHQNGGALVVLNEEELFGVLSEGNPETSDEEKDYYVLLKVSDEPLEDSGFDLLSRHVESAEAFDTTLSSETAEEDFLRTVLPLGGEESSGESPEHRNEKDSSSSSSPSTSPSSTSTTSSASAHRKSAFATPFHERILELPELKFFDNVYNAVYICRICKTVVKHFRKHINEHLNERHNINLLQYFLLYYRTENWSNASLYKCLECQQFHSVDKKNFADHLTDHGMSLKGFSERYGIVAYARSILHCHICSANLFHEHEIVELHVEYHGITMLEFLMGMREWLRNIVGVNNNLQTEAKASTIREEVYLTKALSKEATEPKRLEKPTSLKWATQCKYECKLCDGGAISSYLQLQRHMSIAHKATVSIKTNCVRVEKVKHTCRVCGSRILSDYQTLYGHMKRHNLRLLQYDDVFMNNRALAVNVERMPSAEWDLPIRKASRHEAIKKRKSSSTQIPNIAGTEAACYIKPGETKGELRKAESSTKAVSKNASFSSRQPKIEIARLDPVEMAGKMKRALASRNTARRTSVITRTEEVVCKDAVASHKLAWYQGCVFQCSVCSKTNHSASSLRLHLLNAHEEKKFKSLDHLIEEVFIECKICTKKMLADYDFVRSHLTKFHDKMKVIDYSKQFYPESIDKDRKMQRFRIKPGPKTRVPVDSDVPDVTVKVAARKRLKSTSNVPESSSEAKKRGQRSQSVSESSSRRSRQRTASCVGELGPAKKSAAAAAAATSSGKRRRAQSSAEATLTEERSPLSQSNLAKKRKMSEAGLTKKAVVAPVVAVSQPSFTEWYNGCSYVCKLCSKKVFFRGAKSLLTHLEEDHKVEAKKEQLVESGRETCSYALCLVSGCREKILRDYLFLEEHFKAHDVSVKQYYEKYVQEGPR